VAWFLAPCSHCDRATVLWQSEVALCCVRGDPRTNLAASGGGISLGGGRQCVSLASLDTHSDNSRVEGDAFRDASGVICRLVSVAVAVLYRGWEAADSKARQGEARYQRTGIRQLPARVGGAAQKELKREDKNQHARPGLGWLEFDMCVDRKVSVSVSVSVDNNSSVKLA